jgi:dephospho-CoA kinase
MDCLNLPVPLFPPPSFSSLCAQPRVIPVVGLIGGVGSGKSSVAQRWQAIRPVAVIDADQLGHQVLHLPTVKERIRQRFGPTVFDSQGDIIRSTLGRLVFGASAHQARQGLEAIVHPEIRTFLEREIRELRRQANVEAILLDAAVLLEAGWNELCDVVVFIDTPEADRIARVKAGRGWSAAKLAKREASQWPLPRKRAAADAVIDNSNSVDDAAHQLNQIIRQRFFGQ